MGSGGSGRTRGFRFAIMIIQGAGFRDPRICIGLVVVALLFVVSKGSAADASNEPPVAALKLVREGNALFDAGKYDDAVKKYLSAIGLAPNWHEPHYELAQTYYQLKRNDEATTEYGAAIERDPKCWLCYQGLGNLADDQGNRELALQDYQKAVELGPDEAQPRYNLAITYVRLKKIDDAIAALGEAERLKPGYASPYFLLGRIYYDQSRLYLAFDQLFQATKLEKSGARFDAAKKLIDSEIVIDDKLSADAIAPHMSYCLARSAAITPEGYRKRFPGAETYVDDLNEEKYVLDSFATIVEELSSKKKQDSDFGPLIAARKAGYLVPFILTSSGDRFAKDGEKYEKENPGKLDEFRKWAAANKVTMEPIRPRCEVRWMGRTW